MDQLLIKQKVELVEGRVCFCIHSAAQLTVYSRAFFVLTHEALVGFESNNKYEVRNAMGQNVFYAVEENDCLNRQCCGPQRPFTIRVLDNFGHEIITINRPLKCMSCFFPCCLQEVSVSGFDPFQLFPWWNEGPDLVSKCLTQLEVQSPPGNTVGYVIQQWHPFFPKFMVANEHHEPVLKIHGPFCGWSCLPDVDFEASPFSSCRKSFLLLYLH